MIWAIMIQGASEKRLDRFMWRSLVENQLFTLGIVFVACVTRAFLYYF